MRRILFATAVGAVLGVSAIGPAFAQSGGQSGSSDWQQSLRGLLNGNQQNDQQLRQAYERGFQDGYSRGRGDSSRVGGAAQNSTRDVPPGNGPTSYGTDNGRYGTGQGNNGNN